MRLNLEVEIGVRFKLCHFGIGADSGLHIGVLDWDKQCQCQLGLRGILGFTWRVHLEVGIPPYLHPVTL